MVQRFHDLLPQEQSDIATACAKHGFVPDDFDFIVESAGNARRTISVERVIGGHFQKYPAENGCAWTASFEADLAADWFGAPLAD